MYLLQEPLVQGVSSRRRERLAAETLHVLQHLFPHVFVSAIDRLLLKSSIELSDYQEYP